MSRRAASPVVLIPRCACGAIAALVSPGSDELRGPGGILVARGAPCVGTCEACAVRHGWLVERAA